MAWLVVGLVVFLGIHSVSIVAPAWRGAQRRRLGEGRWKSVYSAISLVGFVVLIFGYGQSRHDPVLLYVPPTGLRHLALLLMLPVFPLLLASGLPGRISGATKHPMLVAIKLWALAHLLANGTLGDVVLFGSFLAWAVVDRISVKRRPIEAQHVRRMPPAKPANDYIAIFGGLLVYGAFLAGIHRWLIGVSPLG